MPNCIGADAALAAGAHKLTVPVSASAAYSLANVRKTREARLEVRAIATLRRALAPQVRLEVGISTAFGCTLQGQVDEGEVTWLAAQCITAGADECGQSDTVGYANPAQVRRMFRRLRAEIGSHAGAAQMHKTYGLGLANCLPAHDEYVRTFDASLGGLGGCPFALGASNNVVTEDLAFMFVAMGIFTGIDLEQLFSALAPLRAGLSDEPLYGTLPNAGLPQGFVQGMRIAAAPAGVAADAAVAETAGAAPDLPPTLLPYAGTQVVEFTHMVMKPTCGMLMGDLEPTHAWPSTMTACWRAPGRLQHVISRRSVRNRRSAVCTHRAAGSAV